MGNSFGVERKVEDAVVVDDDDDDVNDVNDDDETVERGELGDSSDDDDDDDNDDDDKKREEIAAKRERNEHLERAIRKTEKRWLGNNHRGDLKLTGNVFWKPLPHVVGTASFYQDSTLGLANAVNPNPERFGPYISSTDEDESEDWSDEDTTSESSTSNHLWFSSEEEESEEGDGEEDRTAMTRKRWVEEVASGGG